jgi:hypothetical protein
MYFVEEPAYLAPMFDYGARAVWWLLVSALALPLAAVAWRGRAAPNAGAGRCCRRWRSPHPRRRCSLRMTGSSASACGVIAASSPADRQIDIDGTDGRE